MQLPSCGESKCTRAYSLEYEGGGRDAWISVSCILPFRVFIMHACSMSRWFEQGFAHRYLRKYQRTSSSTVTIVTQRSAPVDTPVLVTVLLLLLFFGPSSLLVCLLCTESVHLLCLWTSRVSARMGAVPLLLPSVSGARLRTEGWALRVEGFPRKRCHRRHAFPL